MKKKRKSRGCGGCLLIFLLCLFILGAVFAKPAVKAMKEYLYPLEYQDLIEKYCREYGVSTALAASVVRCESGYDPSAVSSVGAIGLMQMTEDTFDWVRFRLDGTEVFSDLYEPEISIRYGVYYLSYLSDRFGGDRETLAAYHAGMNQVAIWLDDPDYSSDGVTLSTIPFSDTEAYVNRVMVSVEEYRELYSLN